MARGNVAEISFPESPRGPKLPLPAASIGQNELSDVFHARIDQRSSCVWRFAAQQKKRVRIFQKSCTGLQTIFLAFEKPARIFRKRIKKNCTNSGTSNQNPRPCSIRFRNDSRRVEFRNSLFDSCRGAFAELELNQKPLHLDWAKVLPSLLRRQKSREATHSLDDSAVSSAH